MKLKSFFSFFLVLTLILSCCGCSFFNNGSATMVSEEEVTKAPEPSLNLAVLKNNAASLGLLELMKNAQENETNYNINVANNEKEIIKLLDEGKIDAATLPLITAIRYYNSGKTPVKMLYSASYMTVKMLSTKNDVKSVRDFKNQSIYTPGKHTLETASLFYLIHVQHLHYKDKSFTPNFKYANDYNHLLKLIDSDRVNYCVVSEPLATMVMDKYPDFKVCFEPENDYEEDLKAVNMVQDCVVITDKYLNDNPRAVETFMTRCKTSIVYSNYNTHSAAKLAELYQLVASSDLAMKMIQNSKLVFVDSSVITYNNRFLFSDTSDLITKFNLYNGYPPESDFFYR